MDVVCLCLVVFAGGVFVGLICCAAEMERQFRQRLQSIADLARAGIEEVSDHACAGIEKIGNRPRG